MPRMPNSVRNSGRGSRESGFSILELVVALLIAVEILIAMAIAFDVHNKVARVQLQITDMQQALRIAQWDIARLLRMAGRGGMKADLEPGAIFNAGTNPLPIKGRAIELRNNVTDTERQVARGNNAYLALEGTDILTIRGCFADTVFQINPGTFDADSDGDNAPGDAGGNAVLTVPAKSDAGLDQDWANLQAELDGHPGVNGIFGRLLLKSYVASDNWGIAKVTGWSPHPNSDPLLSTIDVDVALGQLPDNATSPLNALDTASAGSPRRFSPKMSASSACLLEEYRYYIRDVREPGDEVTPLRPRLTRARFEPGTEIPYQNDPANLSLDLADQVFDLQVALGFDSDYWSGNDTSQPGSMTADFDFLGDDEVIYEAAADSSAPGRTQDDWLYNDPGDDPGCDTTAVGCDPTTIPYLYHSYSEIAGDPVDLYFVRVTTAARTFRPDNTYRSPDFDTRASGDWLEDHDYDSPPSAALDFNSDVNRKHRHRTLTTVIEMRNIQ